MKHLLYIIITLAAWFPVSAMGQSGSVMGQLVAAYEKGDYQAVLQTAEAALKDTSTLSASDLIYVRTYMAFSLVAQEKEPEALAQFKILLQTKPKMELNPEFVSPKIIQVFKKAQSEIVQQDATERAPSRILLNNEKPSKPSALWRSALWPGWGQSHRGDRTKGKVLRWGSLAVAAGLGVAYLGTSISHRNYDDARNQDDAAFRYRNYNRWYRARIATPQFRGQRGAVPVVV